MKAATIAASPRRATGISHQRRRRGGSTGAAAPSSSEEVGSTITSVVSGLMVSLAVVVAAILAVLVLVFSDQPATEQVRRLRGGRTPVSPRPRSGNGAVTAHAAAPAIRRGPPPATVLQRQLALPPVRPRTPAPAPAPAPV